MLEMRPRSYIFPVRTKKGHDSYTLSPDIITKRFIHVCGSTHPGTNRKIESLMRTSRGPMVRPVVRIQGAGRSRDDSSRVSGTLSGMQP